MATNIHNKDVKTRFPKRLQKMSELWVKRCEPMLKHRQSLLKAYASGFYKEGYSRTHTMNLIDRGVNTIVPYLVEGNPKVLVETKIPKLRPFAFTTQLAMNYFIKKLKLASTILAPAARNSMFGMAVTRTSLTWDRNVTMKDEVYKVGTPSVILIDDSNYIGDPSARSWNDFQIEGDVYQLPTEYAKDFFGSKVADFITPDAKLQYDVSPREVTSESFDRKLMSLREYTTFIDLYIYDEDIVVTIMPEGKKAKILLTVENEFNESPYDKLGYKLFPEEPYPIPPAWSWHDIDVTVNLLVNKMKDQAETQKDIILYEGSAEKDAEKIKSAKNTGVYRVDDIAQIRKESYGGVNPLNYQYVDYMENQFTKQGGNADVLGGRGTQAPTLGQEQMVFQNASRIVNNMMSQFQTFMTSIVRKLAWGYWTDPTVYVPLVKEIPGVATIPLVFSQNEKAGEFYDFSFDILPYSTQRTNPDELFQKTMMFLTQWILPTQQMAAAQGSQLDINELNKILAGYLGLENFQQWYKAAVPTGLEGVDFRMMPMGNPAQGDDSKGATAGSKLVNNFQQQSRAGGQPSPNQQTGGMQI